MKQEFQNFAKFFSGATWFIKEARSNFRSLYNNILFIYLITRSSKSILCLWLIIYLIICLCVIYIWKIPCLMKEQIKLHL